MSKAARPALFSAAAALALMAAPANAQPRAIVVGKITSEKSCMVYQQSAGRSALVATPYAVAAVASWRTWLVKDCVDNFATLRTSLEAALASTGKFAVKTQGAGYSVSGSISQVGGDLGSTSNGPSPSYSYGASSQQMSVSMDMIVRDPAGRIVYGGLFTKRMEVGSTIHTSGLTSNASQSGEGLYTELQHQVALAAARLAAFHIEPLLVEGVNGRDIRLNYGSPLLTLGTIVHVAAPNGAAVRYVVTAANPEGAEAETDGETGDWTRIAPGAVSSVVESDDPVANERRIKRVELP